jgi:HK97 family phage prohead protease
MTTRQPLSAAERKFAPSTIGVDVDGTFSGYASVFGKADLGRDVVEKGAFARAIRERGASGIRMLYQHDPAQPIGTWLEIAEDARGLFVRGRLTGGVERAREVRELMRSGALDGLSIGFRTVRARKDAKTGLRRIIEADLWEISVVTFPMLPEARVETIKRAPRNELPSTREFERWLTRDAQLTRAEARAVIARGFATIAPERDAARATPERLAARIREATRTIGYKDPHP